jgi:hypothetical protein
MRFGYRQNWKASNIENSTASFESIVVSDCKLSGINENC